MWEQITWLERPPVSRVKNTSNATLASAKMHLLTLLWTAYGYQADSIRELHFFLCSNASWASQDHKLEVPGAIFSVCCLGIREMSLGLSNMKYSDNVDPGKLRLPSAYYQTTCFPPFYRWSHWDWNSNLSRVEHKRQDSSWMLNSIFFTEMQSLPFSTSPPAY